MPHFILVDPGRHTPPSSQQPGHELASQTQAPAAQRVPAGQACVPPQRQRPPPPHESAAMGSQAMQVSPAVPHDATDAIMHAPPRQQPLGQEVALQTQAPLTQMVPAAHAALAPHRQVPVAASHALAERATQLVQATPAMPQAANAGAVHVPLVQQP